MKKNFVKKTLASTLALAMVATAMPAAFTTASAAKAPALNKKAKTLYINENEIGSSFDFNISNKVAKSTYKWTTSNKAVATVKSNGLTTAGTKTGKATISCKITLPTKKTKTLKATVTVKENATKVVVKNPVENVGVGENVYDFDSTMTSASGAKATDFRTWEIAEDGNTAGATIDAKSGKVTTTKTGEFKVRVRAYQNKAKLAANDTVDSDWLTVKVNLAIVDTAQKADNKVTLTYNDDLTDTTVPKVSDIIVTNTATNVVLPVQTVSYDGKVVTATLFSSLTDAAEYSVKVGDYTEKINASVGAVASVVINTTTVVKNTAKNISYTLLDANGMDVTNAKASTSNINIELETNSGYLTPSTNPKTQMLTLINTGDTAKVTVTYRTYDYDSTGKETGKASATATIVAVDETAIGAFGKYTIAKSTPNFDKDTMKNTLAVGDTGYKIYVSAKDDDGNAYVTTVGSANSVVKKYTSSDETVLLVEENGTVFAVKTGTAYVIAYDNNDKILWSFPVTVVADRTATALTLANPTVTVSNTANTVDTQYTKLILKDQFDADFSKGVTSLDKNGNIQGTVTPISQPDNATVLPTVQLPGSTNNDITVKAQGATPGTYKYLVAVDDKTSVRTVLTVVVKAPVANATPTYDLVLSSKDVDTTLNSWNDATSYADVTAKVGIYKGGVLDDYATIGTVNVVNTSDSSKIVRPDPINSTTVNLNFATASAADTDTNVVEDKIATGTYKVSTTYTSGSTTVNLVKFITVKDSQAVPSAKVDKETATASATIRDAVNETVTIGGSEDYTVTDVTFSTSSSGMTATSTLPAGSTYKVFVKSVKVLSKIRNNDGAVIKEVNVWVPINKTITIVR